MKLQVSTGMTGKLEGIHALSVSSHNPVCDAYSKVAGSVCEHCYARRYEDIRPMVHAAYTRNLELLMDKVLPMDELPVISTPWDAERNRSLPFRLNSFGEIQSREHLANYLNICRKNPGITFGLWTKRAVPGWFENVPPNLILNYSAQYIGVIPVTMGFFNHTFVVFKREEDIPGYMHKCGGQKCRDCQVCYRKDTPHYIGEVLK